MIRRPAVHMPPQFIVRGVCENRNGAATCVRGPVRIGCALVRPACALAGPARSVLTRNTGLANYGFGGGRRGCD